MKRWYYIVFGAILIGGAVYIYMHRQDLGLVGPADSGTPQPAHFSWVTVDRSEDGFKLEMPAGTHDAEVPAYSEKGGTDQVEMIYSSPDAETTYSIAWEDNPPVERAAQDNPQLTLDDAQQGTLNHTQSMLVTQSESTRQGFAVRDFTGRNDGGGVLSARLILAGRRLYMLMAAFPAASARRDSDVNRFFDSFRVVNGAQND